MNLNLIAAIGLNGELGEGNTLIWRYKEDLKRFRKLTTNGVVIMGGNTFRGDLNYTPLTNRINIILSNSLYNTEHYKYHNRDIYYIINSIDKSLEIAKSFNKPIWIIGGESIYNIFLPLVSSLYITHIKESYPTADKYLKINWYNWEIEIIENNELFNWCNYKRIG